LRIPMPERFTSSYRTKLPIQLAKKGLRVLVISETAFSSVGVIEKIGKWGIVVKLEKDDSLVEAGFSQVLALF